MKPNSTSIILTIALCFIISTKMQSQSLAAYIDYANKFRVFDAGNFQQLDFEKPSRYVVGGNYVAFVSYGNMFRFYYRGKTYDLNEGAFVDKMYNSNCLFAYTMSKQLVVIYNGKNQDMTSYSDQGVLMSDSILFFHDGNSRQYFLYYNGNKIPLEDVYSIDNNMMAKNVMGKNTFLYVNSAKQLRLFYHGDFIDLPIYSPEMNFKCGLDIVVAANNQDQMFKCFFKGSIYDLENFVPKSFEAGDGIAAYVSDDGSFKVFYNGKLKTLDNYEPSKYFVKDSVVYWIDNQNYFKVFCNGEVTTLENYEPKIYTASLGSLAYVDQMNHLKLFKNGKTVTVTYDVVSNAVLYGEVLQYFIGVDESKFYYNGQVY